MKILKQVQITRIKKNVSKNHPDRQTGCPSSRAASSARASEGLKHLLPHLAAKPTRSGRGKMATSLPPLRRTAFLLLAVLVGVLASTARADLVISKADRRVSGLVLASRSSRSRGSETPISNRPTCFGSNDARGFLCSCILFVSSLRSRCVAALCFSGVDRSSLNLYELLQPVVLVIS
jgi:hypothetical protein